MYSINRLKTKSKEILQNTYWQSLAACLLTNFIAQAFSFSIQLPAQMASNSMSLYESQPNSQFIHYFETAFIPIMVGIVVLALAFSIFLTGPITVGLKRFFIKSAQGETRIPAIAEVFKTVNYLNVVKVSFMKNLFLALWTLTGLIPYTVIITVIAVMLPSAIIKYSSLIPFITIISMMPYLIKYYSYFTVDYILAENLQVSWKDAMYEGKEMMRGNIGGAFLLQLSFLGWILLGALACGIGTIFVTPYIEATNTQLYLYLKNNERQYNAFLEK